MSKGDSSKAQNMINYQGNLAQNNLNNVRGNLLPQNQALQNRFNTSADQSQADYGKIMSDYQNQIGTARSSFGPQMAGYGQFAQTGGFSPQDISDIRARAIAPTRAIYQNAQSNIDRNRALQGYSPNYTAATAHLTRGLADATSDANVNANASIAGLIQQGKLSGLSGMTQAEGARLAATLSALGGQTGAYGTAPGMTSMYGNQLGQSNEQYNQLQQLQNQLGLGLISSQINKSQIPGNFQQGLGNIAGIMGLLGKAAPFFGGGTGNQSGMPGTSGMNNWPTMPGYGTQPGNPGKE